ncbi:MAG: hypothetical protein Q8L59_07880 [Phenylobacterium sp.]|uniref:hypothetical protein n=1 Tax=Phenylobacterium sp. TaxID=1871053 RepID=UPI0027346278|nr:hypothetical protein [Phenylobacterium sp.]MDP1642088.1 hypothetical protein [Phenylobacterium sp.]MDP3117865.1 hypothetical protein [Phenylobacterium sp.]MDP3382700.1 hypothetical protein [Phenylobacterium sp.]
MSEPEAPQDVTSAEPTVPGRPDPRFQARRGRNIALALGLIAFAILVFLVTVVRLGANVLDRPL